MYKVLIVDDEKIVRIALKSMLNWEKEGFQICAAAGDVSSALEAIRIHRPQLVITDIEMPGRDGIALMEEARAWGYSGEFIILTNHQHFSYAVDALKNGALDYLIKTDISPENLTAILRKAFQKISVCAAEPGPSARVIPPRDGEAINACLFSGDSGSQPLSSPYFFLYLFLRSRLTGARLDIPVDTLKNVVCEAIQAPSDCVFTVTNDSVILLIPQQDFQSFWQSAENDLTKIQKLIRLYMNTDCGYVSSRLVQTTGELRASLMRCVGAEKLVLYEGFGAVVDEQALDGYTGIPAPFHEAYRAVKRCIFQNSYPEATQIFAQYLSGCREHKVSPSFAFTASERFQNLLLIDYSLWIEQSKPSGADAPNSCLQPVTLEEHIHSFQQLLKTIRKNKTDFSSPSYRREINEIDRLIRENISRHISLSMLSRQVNMTENYISRLFKAETGVNIIYYINLMKLEHAKELLADSDENVKSIAMMLGFDEPSYFNKLFNKTYGVSPTEYRKLLWKQGYRESNTAGY